MQARHIAALTIGLAVGIVALVALAFAIDATDMRGLSALLLIALANNVDNLGARLAYSMDGVRVGLPANLWISLITFAISTAAAASGARVKGALGGQTASFIAMLLLAGLGVWMIFEARRGGSIGARRGSNGEGRRIGMKEATFLGVALSINNIGGGLGAGMIGLSPALTGLFSAIVSFLALWAGNHLAEWFVERKIAGKAAVVGGLLLIALGVRQVVA